MQRTTFMLVACAALLGACQQQKGPEYASSAESPSYAERYPRALGAVRTRFAEDEKLAGENGDKFANFPGELQEPVRLAGHRRRPERMGHRDRLVRRAGGSDLHTLRLPGRLERRWRQLWKPDRRHRVLDPGRREAVTHRRAEAGRRDEDRAAPPHESADRRGCWDHARTGRGMGFRARRRARGWPRLVGHGAASPAAVPAVATPLTSAASDPAPGSV